MRCVLGAAMIGTLSLMSPVRTETGKRETVTLRVLGTAEGEKDVVWVQPMLPPTFAMKVSKGPTPEKGAIICWVEDQGVDRELGGVKGQFIVLTCEGGSEMGVARVDFGGKR